MIRTASRPRHGPEEGLWFLIVIAAIMALAFVAIFVILPK